MAVKLHTLYRGIVHPMLPEIRDLPDSAHTVHYEFGIIFVDLHASLDLQEHAGPD